MGFLIDGISYIGPHWDKGTQREWLKLQISHPTRFEFLQHVWPQKEKQGNF